MADLKVDTQKVAEVASKVEQLNKKLDTSFEDVVKALNGMKSAWSSPSSQKAFDRFDPISDMRDDRKNVITNFTNQLKVSVGQGYEDTETKNQKLADRLK